MREIKAYVRETRVNEVAEGLRRGGFLSMSIAHVRYTQKEDIHILGPLAGLPVTPREMAKLKIVCKKEDVQEVVRILSKHSEKRFYDESLAHASYAVLATSRLRLMPSSMTRGKR